MKDEGGRMKGYFARGEAMGGRIAGAGILSQTCYRCTLGFGSERF